MKIDFIQKIDNHISHLISLEQEQHKIIEIANLNNLVFLINQQINIAKRNDDNISLIFIFCKNTCLNINQYLLFSFPLLFLIHIEYKIRLLLSYGL